jgi:kumamolisin
MRRKFVRKLVIVLIIAALLGFSSFSISLVVQARQDQRIGLSGQIVPLLKRAFQVGAASAHQKLNLSVGLQLRNQQELDYLLGNIYNPHSSAYHQFLTPQMFADEFGPTAQQQQQVEDYLASQGFTVTHVSSNGVLIDASATVSQVEAAFQVKINNFSLGTDRFFANATPPIIPASLSSLIASIGGLDDSVQMQPLYQLASSSREALNKSSSKRSRSHAVPAGFGPPDLTGAYDATPLQQAGIQGANQTVAVFEMDGYQSSDITQYLQQYNLGNPNISNVLVDGFNGAAGPMALEVELDIEVLAAMAPKATQIVYEGPDTTQGINDTYNQIVTDDKAQVATISWGECESDTGNAELQTLDTIFKQGAAEGIAMYAASGDFGAYDCRDNNLAVDSPADDPYITGVGGTTLQLNGGTYGSESVWSNPNNKQRSPNGDGGGGGLSSYFQLPAWQVGPGVKNQYSNGNRQVPDVSADADPAIGYAVYCTVGAGGCSSSGWTTVGGTSGATPLWAGATAIINDYLQRQGKSRIGAANPALYALENSQQIYAPFHDVTAGNNLYYPATANYDEASGWGSPDIYNIARDLAAGNNSSPTPTPGPSGTPSGSPTPPATPTQTPAMPLPTASIAPLPTLSGARLQDLSA